MARPASVTAAAVVAFLGSAVTLLMGVSMIAVALGGASTQLPPRFGIAMGAMFGVLAAVGAASGVGVLRLRPWARVSMLVFSGAMTVFSALGAAFIMMAPQMQTGFPAARAIVAAVYVVPLLVGVWWLVLFTRGHVVAAFADGSTEPASTRPLAVSVIAYWIIIGAVGSVLTSAMGMPAFVAGFVIHGLPGVLVYLFLGALNLYAGVGLLKLQESARVLAITLFGLTVVQSGIMFASPTARERMFAAQAALAPPGTETMTGEAGSMALGFMGIAAVFAAVGILLLVRAKAAFK